MRSSTDFDVVQDDRELIQHACLLMITCIRANQGFILDRKIYDEPDDVIDQVIQMSEAYMTSLLKKTEYGLTDSLYREISRGVFYEFYNWDNPQQEVRIQTAVDKFLDKLVSGVNYRLPEEDRKKISQRMMHWYLSYAIYPYDRVVLRNESESSARNIRRLYPIFSKLVEVNLKEIENDCNFPWAQIREDDILCLLLKDWSSLPQQLESLRRQVTVLIISDRGLKHSHMLREIIKGQMLDKVVVDIFKSSVLFITPTELECFHDYDIVVANNPIPDYQDENLLLVDNFMSEGDWNLLHQRVIRKQKQISDDYIHDLDINRLKSGREIYPQRKKAANFATFVMEEDQPTEGFFDT